MLYYRFRYTVDLITALKATNTTSLKCVSCKAGVRQPCSNTSITARSPLFAFLDHQLPNTYYPPKKMSNENGEHQRTDL